MSDPRSDRPRSYRDAGVDLGAADRALASIERAVASTVTPGVLSRAGRSGSFGGMFRLPAVEDGVLVASTDGVGTKTMVAAALGRWRGVGRDLVNHCVNDVAAQGARPLFFLDYVASARLEPEVIAEVVGGVADACRANGAALLGGETAEMPGVYRDGELDLVGTVVGIVAEARIVDGSRVRAGDALLALPSGGLQTNGFSLARALLAGRYDEALPGGGSVGAALLAEHRSFWPALRPLLDAGLVRALAHVTGGGIPGNLPRALPAGLGARVDPGAWEEPAIFGRIRELGGIPEREMRSVFNLGVGMIAVVSPTDAARARDLAPALRPIGVVTDAPGVEFVGD